MANIATGSSSFPSFLPSKASTGVFNKRIMQTVSHDWHEAVSSRLEYLTRLPHNWDGYGGKPVSFLLAHFTMSMLSSACPLGSSAPQLVPGHNGDLQAEWHTLEYDIELHVLAPYRVTAVRCAGDDVEEIQLTNDFTVVAEWLNAMEVAVAARQAAA